MTINSLEAQDMLGKTGKTVVYVFPQGAAYKSREKTAINFYLDMVLSDQPTLIEAEPIDAEAIVQTLLDQGKLTPGQLQVARYDQQMTDMTLLETLYARGWLPQEVIDRCWDQLV